jgi:hypothetical protein
MDRLESMKTTHYSLPPDGLLPLVNSNVSHYTKKVAMFRRLAVSIGSFAIIVAAVLFANYLLVHRSLSSVLDSDTRNNGVAAFAYYDYFVFPSTLVFDLRGVSETNSPADVFRVLLQFAASQKDRDYEAVKIAFRGKPKFLLKGAYFKTLGVEYGTQNPVYTMRTFPENLYRSDGTAAFGMWTGGLFGVLGKQTEDFIEFHKQWYVNELAKTGG